MDDGFMKRGRLWESTFEPTTTGLRALIKHAYSTNFAEFNPLMRAAGAAGYGLAGSEGMFNQIYGFKATAAMYGSKRVVGSLQKRAYDHQGLRIIPMYATYGLGKDIMTNGTKVFDSQYDNVYMGLGAAAYVEGPVTDSVQLPIDEIDVRYKELDLSWDYGLAIKMLEGKDDTTKRDMYAKIMGDNFDQQMDLNICRPIYGMPYIQNPDNNDKYEETSLTGLARVISSGLEVGKTYDGNHVITIDDVLPWGGFGGSGYAYTSSLKDKRFTDAELSDRYRGSIDLATTHTENNYDCQLVDADGQPLSLDHLDELYMKTYANWDDGAEGKFWLMSPVDWMRTSKLATANHVDTSKIYSKNTINGMSAGCEGTDFGFNLNSYRNVPIMEEPHLNFDYSTGRAKFNKGSTIFMVDGQHTFIRWLSPVQMYAVENPAITGTRREKNTCIARAELACDKWISQGKIVGVA